MLKRLNFRDNPLNLGIKPLIFVLKPINPGVLHLILEFFTFKAKPANFSAKLFYFTVQLQKFSIHSLTLAFHPEF